MSSKSKPAASKPVKDAVAQAQALFVGHEKQFAKAATPSLIKRLPRAFLVPMVKYYSTQQIHVGGLTRVEVEKMTTAEMAKFIIKVGTFVEGSGALITLAIVAGMFYMSAKRAPTAKQLVEPFIALTVWVAILNATLVAAKRTFNVFNRVPATAIGLVQKENARVREMVKMRPVHKATTAERAIHGGIQLSALVAVSAGIYILLKKLVCIELRMKNRDCNCLEITKALELATARLHIDPANNEARRDMRFFTIAHKLFRCKTTIFSTDTAPGGPPKM